jgi:hypothetical protein
MPLSEERSGMKSDPQYKVADNPAKRQRAGHEQPTLLSRAGAVRAKRSAGRCPWFGAEAVGFFI